MAVAFDVASTGAGTSPSWSHTCTGTNLLLVVQVGDFVGGDAESVTGITYNGVALSLFPSHAFNVARTSLWYLIAPATGAHTLAVTSGSTVACVASSWTGVHQTVPLGAGVTNTASAGQPTSVSITGAVGSMLIAHTGNLSDDLTDAGTQTATGFVASGGFVCNASYKAGAGSATTLSWTGYVSDARWAVLAVEIKASGLSSTFYLQSVLSEQDNQYLLLPDGPAPTTNFLIKWTVGTTAPTQYARMGASPTFGATAEPNGEPNGARDSFRTGRLRGTVPAGTWTLSVPVQAFAAGGAQDGRIRCRVWQSAYPQGQNATELTSGVQLGTTVTNLSTSVAQTSTVTMTMPAITLSDEFIFVQLAWEITGAGASVVADVWIKRGPTSTLVTPAFTVTEMPSYGAGLAQTTATTPVWTDLSDRLLGYESRRGRADNLSGITAGQLQIDLDDDDGDLDPENTGGAYYPNLKLQRRIRVAASYAGITYGRGLGYIDSYAASPQTLGADVSLTAEDLYARLLKQKVTTTRPAEADYLRFFWLLFEAGITASMSSDGSFVPPAVSLVKASILEHFDLLVKAGRGTFFINASGTPIYRDRHWRLTQTSIGTFGAQGDYPIPTPQPVLDMAGIFNQVTMERSGSVNEVQRITMGGSVTAGVFYLSFRGQTTSWIGYNASAGTVQAALEALSTIGASNVSCSGGPFPNTAVTVTFTNTLGSQDVPELTTTSALGGSSPTVTVSTVTPGINELQTVDDTASQADYGVITFELEQAAADMLASDEDALQWSDWFLLQHAQPTSRFRRIKIDPWADPALWPLVFAADIGTRLTIHHDLPGTSGIDEDYYIEGIEESVTFEGVPEPVIYWNVSRAEGSEGDGDFWILDTSLLGTDTVLAY